MYFYAKIGVSESKSRKSKRNTPITINLNDSKALLQEDNGRYRKNPGHQDLE